jgi:hypothetical protein
LFLYLALGIASPGLAAPGGGGIPAGSAGLGKEIATACVGAPVVILGERHREPRSHALFLDMVDAFLSRGERVVVGLEIGSDRQAELEAALQGLHPSVQVAHPLVDSTSYRELLRGLGRWAGRPDSPLKVRAIDAPSGAGIDRDTEMAYWVRDALEGESCDRVLVLVGNLHALKEIPWTSGVTDPQAKLAGLLAGKGVEVVSLVQQFQGSCPGTSKATFYPAGAERTFAAVRNLWGALNTDPSSAGASARLAADGVVSWTCE